MRNSRYKFFVHDCNFAATYTIQNQPCSMSYWKVLPNEVTLSDGRFKNHKATLQNSEYYVKIDFVFKISSNYFNYILDIVNDLNCNFAIDFISDNHNFVNFCITFENKNDAIKFKLAYRKLT